MRRFLRNNSLSLSLVMFALFAFALVGQIATGFDQSNQDLQDHGQPTEELAGYLTSGHFTEAVFENWESEFLQMAVYVLLTAKLRQKGSSESKKMEGEEEVDREPDGTRKGAPWPVRRGGVVLWLYQNSLSLALIALFLMSFAFHAIGGAVEYSEEQQQHSGEPVTAAGFLTTSAFWFQSFQNWQSEFLSIGALVVLSVFLRQKGSPESKPVDAPNEQTGSD